MLPWGSRASFRGRTNIHVGKHGIAMRSTVHNQNRVLVMEGRQRYLLRKKAVAS